VPEQAQSIPDVRTSVTVAAAREDCSVGGRHHEWDVESTDERAGEIEVGIEPVAATHGKVPLAHVEPHRPGDGADRILRALDGPSPGEKPEPFGKAVARGV
jgi:hypothetical protein